MGFALNLLHTDLKIEQETMRLNRMGFAMMAFMHSIEDRAMLEVFRVFFLFLVLKFFLKGR